MGPFVPIPEDAMSTGAGDERSLISREGNRTEPNGMRSAAGNEAMNAGIEVKRDFNVVFERQEPAAYELENVGYGRAK